MATLAQGPQISQPVIGGIMVKVRSRQRHPGCANSDAVAHLSSKAGQSPSASSAKFFRLHPTIDHRLNAGPHGHAVCRTAGTGPWLVQTGSPPKVAASRKDKTICTGDGLASSFFKCAMIRAHPTDSACSRFASTHGAAGIAFNPPPALVRPVLVIAAACGSRSFLPHPRHTHALTHALVAGEIHGMVAERH
jgi:hypothetical protein